jgi:hypothetical protein
VNRSALAQALRGVMNAAWWKIEKKMKKIGKVEIGNQERMGWVSEFGTCQD